MFTLTGAATPQLNRVLALRQVAGPPFLRGFEGNSLSRLLPILQLPAAPAVVVEITFANGVFWEILGSSQYSFRRERYSVFKDQPAAGATECARPHNTGWRCAPGRSGAQRNRFSISGRNIFRFCALRARPIR